VSCGDAPRSVQLSPSAVRALDRLPHKVAAAIVEFVTGTLPADPYRLSMPLRFEFEGWRVARRGDYRERFARSRTITCSTSAASSTVPMSVGANDREEFVGVRPSLWGVPRR
jgi:mRNA interferase RelE/StbE